jgi:hypothetical protein
MRLLLSRGAGRSSYSARRRVSAPEDACPRPGYRLRSRTSATTRRTSGGRYSYRSRAQITVILGGPSGLIHRPGRARGGQSPARPVNKSGDAIRGSRRATPGSGGRNFAPAQRVPEGPAYSQQANYCTDAGRGVSRLGSLELKWVWLKMGWFGSHHACSLLHRWRHLLLARNWDEWYSVCGFLKWKALCN